MYYTFANLRLVYQRLIIVYVYISYSCRTEGFGLQLRCTYLIIGIMLCTAYSKDIHPPVQLPGNCFI